MQRMGKAYEKCKKYIHNGLVYLLMVSHVKSVVWHIVLDELSGHCFSMQIFQPNQYNSFAKTIHDHHDVSLIVHIQKLFSKID